jgi:uncharacterized membrane protein YfcA
MSYLMGAFFASVGVYNLYRMLRPPRKEGVSREVAEGFPAWRKTAVGLPMGLLAGLLGVGGGVLAVPGQQLALRMPLRSAIGTSAATILCISWLGAILKNARLGENGDWHTSLLLAAMLTPTAIIGSFIGGHLTHRLPLKLVRGAFVAFLVASAYKIFAG